MTLGFKTKVNGKLTHFVQKILACVLAEWAEAYVPKKHTIRHGKRWFAGRKLHLAIGVRTKNYLQFNKNIKGLEVCKSVQDIKITHQGGAMYVEVDGKHLPSDKVKELAINDGFDTLEDFMEWFNTDFEGQIIHWTDLKY